MLHFKAPPPKHSKNFQMFHFGEADAPRRRPLLLSSPSPELTTCSPGLRILADGASSEKTGKVPHPVLAWMSYDMGLVKVMLMGSSETVSQGQVQR